MTDDDQNWLRWVIVVAVLVAGALFMLMAAAMFQR